MLVMVLADVAFVSAEMVFYDKKSDFNAGIHRPAKMSKVWIRPRPDKSFVPQSSYRTVPDVNQENKTDQSTSPWRSMDPYFSDCCRSNDDHHFISNQKNQWLHDSIQKLNFIMPDPYEHQNSTGYCFEEEKHYDKYKKMSKIFHCCSLAVLSLMMVEDMVGTSLIWVKYYVGGFYPICWPF